MYVFLNTVESLLYEIKHKYSKKNFDCKQFVNSLFTYTFSNILLIIKEIESENRNYMG